MNSIKIYFAALLLLTFTQTSVYGQSADQNLGDLGDLGDIDELFESEVEKDFSSGVENQAKDFESLLTDEEKKELSIKSDNNLQNSQEYQELNSLLDEGETLKDNTLQEEDLDLSKAEELDDLESIKQDLGDDFLDLEKEFAGKKTGKGSSNVDLSEGKVVNPQEKVVKSLSQKVQIFDVGKEEKDLLEISKFVESKIPEKEWSEIAGATREEKYVIQEGEWLWKISKKLFGSGFYYAKIWALNPYITNPHEITPGDVLVFDTGDELNLPTITLDNFSDEKASNLGGDIQKGKKVDLSYFGDEIESNWLQERERLKRRGVHIQLASEATYKDLDLIQKQSLNKEYEKYAPPIPKIVVTEPDADIYDRDGFDRSSIIRFNYKEGFFLNTFLTTNFVQDLGEIKNARTSNSILGFKDIIYIKFDSSVNVAPGDMFSVYTAQGNVNHRLSDRKGQKYTIIAQVRAMRTRDDLWEAQITEVIGTPRRGDRLTVYTPRIDRITKSFNTRNIEAVIMSGFEDKSVLVTGDVVYLDRGRADGVELGNIFEAYSFRDRSEDSKISVDPTYKIGEIAVISLSDNFATGLITQASYDLMPGQLALSKTVEQVARDARIKNRTLLKSVREMEAKALEELDVELNLEDINEDLLDKADKVELTDDELEELERQERDKSIIRDHERDLKQLERLEQEIESAEAQLSESKIDEDKFLEQENLNQIEGEYKVPDENAFEALDEIERASGRKYMDEDLNSKENPYGLTEYDIEEIDELLGTEIN